MEVFTTLLVGLQAVGAVLGAVSAVLAELAYVRAMRDGHIERAERRHIDVLARGLYWGMTLLLVASLALVVLAYRTGASVQPALTSSYWSFIGLALLVTTLSWALSRKRVSFGLGSAAIFMAWWFLAYLTLGRFPPLSFGASIALYVVATGAFYGLLCLLRYLMTPAERKALHVS